MAYSTFTNRNGMLVIRDTLITSEIMAVLTRLNEFNLVILTEDDVACTVAVVQEELNPDTHTMDMAAAIFVNAKNYLVTDKNLLITDLRYHNINLHLIKGCFVPMDTNYAEMYFLHSVEA